MSTIATLINHQVTPGAAIARASALPLASSTSGTGGTSSTSGSSDSSDSSATISANDFLTLLVTEMQNQDPTSDTDPNEYIDQLVNVNSLEQLIDINQTLSTDLAPPSSSSATGTSADATSGTAGAMDSASPVLPARSLHTAHGSALLPASGAASSATAAQAGSTFGNLSAPPASSAAHRVGHALTQRVRSPASGGIPLFSE